MAGVTGREIKVPPEVTYADLLKDNSIACATAMIDRSKVKGEIKMGHAGSDFHEDFSLWLELVKAYGPRSACGKDLARYRIVPGSRSSKKLLMAQWRWKVYREQEELSFWRAIYFYGCYAMLAVGKRLRF